MQTTELLLDPRAARPARVKPGPTPARPGLFVAAVWAGLVVGLLEVVLLVARVELSQHGLYRKSPHFLWTTPLVDLTIFGSAGLLAMWVGRIPRVGGRLAAWFLCTLALMTPLLGIPGLRASSCLVLAGGLACWVEPTIRARSVGFHRLIRASLPPLGLAVLVLAGIAFGGDWMASGRGSTGVKAPPGAPNVLFLVMDTVRADAMSLPGAARDTTPNLAALASRGARFEEAIATAPWTLPSHASMFTGRWPSELAVGPDRALDARYPTLAEYLDRHGYATAGFVANTVFCTREYGLSRGFGHYEDFPFSSMDAVRGTALGWWICLRLTPVLDRLCLAAGRSLNHPLDQTYSRKDAAAINRAALRWIARPRDRPFFVFLNYLDAHDPYLLPAGSDAPFRRRPPTLEERKVLRDWIGDVPRARTPAEIHLARDAYDDCLAALDHQIGRLIAELDRLGQLENTVLVVTADHGEHFGEHTRAGVPLVGHRTSLYQPEIHVPLLIVAPKRISPRTVVPEAVSLRNLPATIVDLVGLPKESPFPGQSLVSAAGGEGTAFAEFSSATDPPAALRYQPSAPGLMRVVIADGKALHRLGAGREEFYDLQADPRESLDLTRVKDHPPLLDPYRALLNHLAPAR